MEQESEVRTIVIREQSNSLGLAGFICSIVGLVSCGLLSPIGAGLSFFGLFRTPRGMAIAGFIIGLAGSIWVIVLVFVIGVGTVLAALGWKQIEATAELAEIQTAVGHYVDSNGALPPSLDTLPEASKLKLNDPWGRPYRYLPDMNAKSYTLSSDGPDGIPGNADDVSSFSSHVEFDTTAPKK